MSIKRLLTTTAAIAALAPGLAHAAASLTPGASGVAGAELITDYDLAQEASLSGAGLTTTVGLQVGIAGVFPPGQNILLTLNVQGGTFTSALTGAAEVGTGATGATVNSGGAKGGSTVRYLVTANAGADGGVVGADHIGIKLPITFSGCPATLSFTLSELTTESGTVIEGGTATLNNQNASPLPTDFLVRCVNAISTTLVPDYTVTSPGNGIDSKLALPGPFQTFFAQAGHTAPFVADVAAGADIGYYATTISATAVKTIAAAGPAAIVPGDVTGFTTTLTFSPAATRIEDATSTPNTGALFTAGPTAPVGSSIALVGATPATTLTPDGVLSLDLIAAGGATGITPHTPAVTNCAVTLGAGFVATDPCSAASVDDLDENGILVGPFDWVGDFSKPTQNVFRVTGLGATLPTIRVKLANASASSSFNGTYTIPGLSLSGGEVIINTQAIQNAVGGNFGRADVSFLIVKAGTNDASLDVDRLMSTGGIVTSFGNDESVFTNSADGDDN